MSAAHNETGNIAECLKFSKMAHKAFAQAGDSTGADMALYYQACDYYNNGKLDTAFTLCERLVADDNLDTETRGYVLSSYAFFLTYSKSGTPERTDSLFSEAIKVNGDLNGIEDWSAYAYNLSLIGEEEKSERTFVRLSKMGSASHICDYFRALAMKTIGDESHALEYMTSAYDMTVNPGRYAAAGASIKGQRDYFASISKHEHSKFLLSLLSTLLVLSALSFLTWSIVKRHRKERDDYKRDRTLLMEELGFTKAQLDEMAGKHHDERLALRSKYVQLYKEQFKFIDAIALSITNADWLDDEQLKYQKVYEKARELVGILGSDTERQKEFEKEIDKNLNGIMSKYRKDFPNKKEEDYRFVSYLFAGLSPRLIATLLGMQSINSVYTRKQRVKTSAAASNSNDKPLYLELLG